MGIIDNIKEIIENKKNSNKQQEKEFIQQQKKYEEILTNPDNFNSEEIYQTFSLLGKNIDDIIDFAEKNFYYVDFDLIEKYFHISIVLKYI